MVLKGESSQELIFIPYCSFTQRPKGLAPTLTGEGSTESMSNIKDTVNKHRFNKEDICFSHITPLQKQRRDHIDEIEFGLLLHPLALYPHLEEGVPPDVSRTSFPLSW